MLSFIRLIKSHVFVDICFTENVFLHISKYLFETSNYITFTPRNPERDLKIEKFHD